MKMEDEEEKITPRDKGIVVHEPSAPKKAKKEDEDTDYISRWMRLVIGWIQRNN